MEIKNTIKNFLIDFPILWKFLYTINNKNTRHLSKLVHKDTDLVIEGPPRCANSYTYRIFCANNDPYRSLQIATHTHHIAQLKLAIKWKIPIIVCLRTPSESLISEAAHYIMLNKINNKQAVLKASKKIIVRRIKYWKNYLRFLSINQNYQIVILNHSKFNLRNAIKNINNIYGLEYSFEITVDYDRNKAKPFIPKSNKTADRHALPSKERDKIKLFIKNQKTLVNEISDLDECYINFINNFKNVNRQ